MNPIHAAAAAAAAQGKRIRCAYCGNARIIPTAASARRYRCKKCGRVLSENQPHSPSR